MIREPSDAVPETFFPSMLNSKSDPISKGFGTSSGLKAKLIDDVRDKGLLLGIELVKDRATKEPATSEYARVLQNCREINADFLLDALDRAFYRRLE